ncbi:UDP-N-acetylmuramoyl-L-alanyl-D-glutamate--2,6-diaminopimelate ligase [Luteitalea sp. TBR-22]|uniref:UDP-N-acetylmuramoyl-L-alanyl-D-glutamate--2, 6-diaminopimelate ligase n=1 Tax=Luteitalea sp. TBR-22 TaxID=2802971 RepID=UPI001AFC4348|nr:UDP-N-acetylmuramoyl-L-alanyl-D-glutamate--2,6-diaminopimelate ligase [Luteitalea sp. TBR-22]BCS35662.1 UDP-N-acetylmuramoyl-L-alanyl-D-glutamate--2,6-diaminopimelate ligase [Luteitalea sp. TBR-22]
MAPWTLEALLADVVRLTPLQVPDLGASAAQVVTGIAYDSRAVAPGALFVALRGTQRDGTEYAAQAIARGAIAIVADRAAPAPVDVPWVVAERGRTALAACAATYHRHPSDHLLLVGVTGTNGKTTSTYLLEGVFTAAGWTSGRIGTTGTRIGAEERPSARTTPEAPDLQGLLREMVDAGCRACAMEVSSHALDLERVAFTRFGAAIFTNLTRDHLDYHGDMEAYFRAKRRLFEMLPPEAPAAINLDDPRGESLLGTVRRPVTFALAREADVMPTALALTLGGIEATLRTPAGELRLRTRLPGRPNAYNALGVVAACVGLGLPVADIERGLADMPSVPGRFELVSSAQDEVSVIVDYAHTDDALKNLLETARALAPQRIVTVFGCGGDRDRTKRPLMGAVAARLSDLVILTSDNPRSEDPAAIIDDIKRGLVQPERPARHAGQAVAAVQSTPWRAIVDREEAITRAILEAKPGDLVVIAGKGHESTQTIGDRVLPFEDGKVARAALRRRGGAR